VTLIDDTAWLQNGLWLKDAIVRLAGTTPVGSYSDARAACRNLPWQGRGGRTLTPEERQRSAQRDELHDACVAPLIDALNKGRVIAVRPDFNSSQFVRLLPPATGWRLQIFDLEKSLIFDPKSSSRSLFVLFMVADREPAVTQPVTTAGPADATFRSSKSWLTWAVANLPPDDWKRGWKGRYAKKLAVRMAEDAKTHKKIKPLDWTSIRARLNEHKLWPDPKQHD
jgi:hypothetical protein